MPTRTVARNRRRKTGTNSWETVSPTGKVISRTTKRGRVTETTKDDSLFFTKRTTTYNDGHGQSRIETNWKPKRRGKKNEINWLYVVFCLVCIGVALYRTWYPD